MTIAYNEIPADLNIPFIAVEFDSTRALQGSGDIPYKGLLIGQRISAGTGVADTLYKVRSAEDVIGLAGRGSLAHRMARAWFANKGQYTETWLGLLDDDDAGVAAEGSIVVGGPATAAGTIALYIGRDPVLVSVASGDASTAIATAIGAAINAAIDLPISATVDTSTVTLTARGAGTYGNEINVRVNYNDGERTPAGVTLTITPMADGANNPALDDLIAAMGDIWFTQIATPYKDNTSMTALKTELADRWGPMRQIDCQAFAAQVDSYANLITLGDTPNSKHVTIVGDEDNPTPAYELAAMTAAVVAYYARKSDVARPFQGLPLLTALPPAENERLTNAERNILLTHGIATLRHRAGGVVQLERLITTYKTNASGSPDKAYYDLTTLMTLMYLRYNFRTRMATKYERYKLADDSGRRYSTGQKVMTPALGRTEAVGWFRDMQDLVLVDGSEAAFKQFKQDLVVERDQTDVNRLNFLLPPDLMNQLIVTAAQIQPRL